MSPAGVPHTLANLAIKLILILYHFTLHARIEYPMFIMFIFIAAIGNIKKWLQDLIGFRTLCPCPFVIDMTFGDKPKLECHTYMTANHVSQWVDALFSFCRYDQHVSSQVCSLVLCVALCWRCSYSSSSLVRMIICLLISIILWSIELLFFILLSL